VADFAATGEWRIIARQRELPRLKDYAHNYAVLVDGAGNIVSEIHGRFTTRFYMNPLGGGEKGNYLRVDQFGRNGYMPDDPAIM
jgi:hypothetical protein